MTIERTDIINIRVFLSFSSPITKQQEIFKKRMEDILREKGYEPLSLGTTDYDINAPLAGCRRLMLECNGLITLVLEGIKLKKPNQDLGKMMI